MAEHRLSEQAFVNPAVRRQVVARVRTQACIFANARLDSPTRVRFYRDPAHPGVIVAWAGVR